MNAVAEDTQPSHTVPDTFFTSDASCDVSPRESNASRLLACRILCDTVSFDACTEAARRARCGAAGRCV